MSKQLDTAFLNRFQELKNSWNDGYLALLNESSFKYCPPPLKEAVLYSLQSGGKRIRPILTLETGHILELNQEKSLAMAIAVELIHTYSLIHDDLPSMDNDAMRRGQPTAHIKFGEDVALLAGDGLQALAFEILARAKTNSEVIAYFARNIGLAGMVGGQYLDVMSSTEKNVLYLKKMHAMKTGALFQTCVVMPFIEQALFENVIEIEKWTLDLGTLFQIADDILDHEADSRLTSKSSGEQNKLHKLNYVEVFGFDGAKDKLNQTRHQLLLEAKSLFKNSILLQKMADYISFRNA